MAQEKNKLDAGLKSLDHYKDTLPRWRHSFREKLLPVVRWETPYVAWLQDTMRSASLDTYFAMSANLGTHTFYMIMLPVLFWCGYAEVGRGMVQILAAGVFFSGFFKDLLCLPRPLSPPLQRITMSGSAALEYGFPSTHSTNAVSVAVYVLHLLNESTILSDGVTSILRALAYSYAFSIVMGRLYCGMHGFFDVVWGSALGALLGWLQCRYGTTFDAFLHESDFQQVAMLFLIILVLIRIHPEPADDCPCYDDSVAFAGTTIGVELGCWHFARTAYSWKQPIPGTVPFSLREMGLIVTIARIILGVFVIFIWRGVMKPTLLKIFPPVFRVIETYGLTLPRRFFTPASQYKSVPPQRHDDNVIPPAREIPGMLSAFRRRRAVSVGPQSEADAYEALAYQDKKRREIFDARNASNSIPEVQSPPGEHKKKEVSSGGRRRSSSLDEYKVQMAMGARSLSPAAKDPAIAVVDGIDEKVSVDDVRRSELFANVQKPRVRYDVEVVTKLIVYTGIGWLACEGDLILFEHVGLGMR